MKRWLWIILPLIMAACGPASASPTVLPTTVNGQEYTQAPGFSSTRTSAINPGLTKILPSMATGTSTSTATLAPSETPTLTDTITPSPSPTYIPTRSNAIPAISAGGYTTCALTLGGGVKCWGDGTDGEVGDGKSGDVPNNVHYVTRPVDVIGLTTGVIAIAVGDRHVCALTSGGGVKCWGDNTWGELGDGTTNYSAVPVDVSGLTSGVSAIVAAHGTTCALTSGGDVKCWGANYFGELGNGTTNNSTTPVDVSGLTSKVSAIAAGGATICALTLEGGAKCWGANDTGQLGDGTITNTPPNGKTIPVDVFGLETGVSSIAVGQDHVCALTSSGAVKCWGDNEAGELGDGTTIQRLTPVDVTGLTSGVSSISAGVGSTCALTLGGGVEVLGSQRFRSVGRRYNRRPSHTDNCK